jgi:gas vesicle protein
MKEQGSFTGSQLTVAFLGGALAGAAVAILTAPRSGRETREQLGGYIRNRRQQKNGRMADTGRSPEAFDSGHEGDMIDVTSVQ